MSTFSIKKPSSVIEFWFQANLWEYSTDKPGNVGPSQEINQITLKDYDRVNHALRDYLFAKIFELPRISLGNLIFSLVDTMMQTAPHQNLLLGNILLISPLFLASVHLSHKFPHRSNITRPQFWHEVIQIIAKSTVDDTLKVVDAIRLAQPGGLVNPGGKSVPADWDILNSTFPDQVVKRKIHLISLFQKSASYDLISHEWAYGYQICQNWLYTHNLSQISPVSTITKEITKEVQQIFLEFLASYPDSLIQRKNSLQEAKNIQILAQKILHSGGKDSIMGSKLLQNLTKKLSQREGKFNPGTTADFTAAILFLRRFLIS
ncbi:MAG: triphosphoribosyl-dephospho-CoA synthase [Promethearchaeota archaeon]